MRKTVLTKAWGRYARIAALGAGILLLAGCATGYSLVQPNVAGSGSYYTSSEPYTGQGYYDYYGTGPYYSGTSGWGYYNGTYPDSNLFGWYGGYFGGYGYWSPFIFNVGVSNVWDIPGYWGPWYSVNFPIWGCYSCGYWHHHHRHHGQQPQHSSDTSSRHWVKRDRPFRQRRPAHNGAPPLHNLALPLAPLPVEGFANRRSLESAAFAPHDFVRAPVRRAGRADFRAMPLRPASALQPPVFTHRRGMSIPATMPRALQEPAFAGRRGPAMPMATPRNMGSMPHPAFHPAPMRAAPAASRGAHASDSVKIKRH